jgi:ABC-type nitrate/sulfonate/bicarbonate transport system substrate-binding protein
MNLEKVLICLVLVVAVCSPAGAWAQAKKIKVGYSSDAPGSLVTWLARETGIFAKNGLEAELVRTRTTIGVMALLSGELDFIQASGPVVIESNLRGSDLVYIAGGMATLDFIFMSQPEIKTARCSRAESSDSPRFAALRWSQPSLLWRNSG